MDAPIKPALLPEYCRPRLPDKPSDLPETVRGLNPSLSGFTVPDAIRVDRGWGVWLDLDAPVKFVRPQDHPPESHPVRVMVHNASGGRQEYSVDLSHTRATDQRWTPSLIESFDVDGLRQFVPVSQVS